MQLHTVKYRHILYATQRACIGQASEGSSAVVQTVGGLVSLSLRDLISDTLWLPADSSYSEIEHCAASLQH